VAILVIALGIGANTAIFTVVRAVLLAPLPYRDPDRLVRLFETNVVNTTAFNVVSAPNFYDWRSEATSFESMGYYGDWGSSFSPSDGGLPENLTGAICDSGFFNTLGVQPEIGRAIVDGDDRRDADRVVVISHSFWRRRFNENPSTLGSTIRLDGEIYTVIGIMPAAFDFPVASAQIWLPVGRVLNPSFKQMRGNHRFNVIARLKPGVAIEHARSELDGIARQIRLEHPGELTGRGANVVSLADRMVSGVRPMLLVLLGAVAWVLLIACVNVTNLLLARAVARKREIAIRTALGAAWTNIVRSFLVESLLLSFIGAALGMALAMFATAALIQMAAGIPRVETVHVDAQVLVFTVVITVLTGLSVGLFPALASSHGRPLQTLQEGGRSATAARSRAVFRDVMLGAEIALSLMLLVGAGLMLKSFAQLRAVDPGFAPEGILTIRFSLPSQRYKTPAQVAGFYRELVDSVRDVPGVASVGMVTVPPLAGHYMDNTFTIDGRLPLPPGQFLDAVVRSADPHYFRSAGIPIKRGRVFTSSEWLDSADKAVISESMAAAFFPNEDPIGKRIRITDSQAYEIVGIVGDTRQNLANAPEPVMYFPLFRGDYNFATLMIRAARDPNRLSLPIQKLMRNLDPDLPAVTVRTMDEIMGGATETNRFGLTLITLFAGLAVILSSIGLYGVLAYSVNQRTAELGVRMALGADRSTITRLIVLQGIKPAVVGVVAGIAGSFAGTRSLQTMLYQVKPTDPVVLGLVVVLFLSIVLAACLIPAVRATRIDPVIALRSE
jgi:putative ABC transport system permease protein